MNTRDIGWEIISRHLSGHISASDRSRLEAWIRENPARRQGLIELEQRWKDVVRPDQIVDSESHWLEFQQKLQTLRPRPASSSNLPSTTGILRGKVRSWIGVAGVAAICFGLCVALGSLAVPKFRTFKSETPRTIQTLPGQTASFEIGNGSRVILAPSSTVWLTTTHARVIGEAYFSIEPNARHPFSVATANATVSVLGTKFTVRQYSSDRDSRVVVEEGRVVIVPSKVPVGKGKQVILGSGMLANVTDSVTTAQSGVAVNNYTGWTTGRLVFDVVPLKEVAAELSRAYGVGIRLSDSTLGRERISLTVTVKSQPLSEVLDILTPVVDAHYVRVDSTFVITPGRSGVRTPRARLSPHMETVYGK